MRRRLMVGGLAIAVGCGKPADPPATPTPPTAAPVTPVGHVAAEPEADDALFARLHDPATRAAAEAELRQRGRTDDQIQLGRQLASPDPADRLRLLLDLSAGDGVNDVGPWLERLSRDPEPAVRLGAARLACECKVVYAGWLDRLADADPDPLVRQWAGYWRDKAKGK
jgi:hypothetical protein